MPGFRFELERLLEHRRRTERQQQRVVGELEQQRAALERDLNRAQTSIVENKSDLRQALHPGEDERADEGASRRVDVRAVRLQASSSLRMVMRAREAALGLAGAQRRLEQAREQLRQVSAQRRAVEALKQRRYEAWLRRRERRETVAQDEIAIARVGNAGADHAEGRL